MNSGLTFCPYIHPSVHPSLHSVYPFIHSYVYNSLFSDWLITFFLILYQARAQEKLKSEGGLCFRKNFVLSKKGVNGAFLYSKLTFVKFFSKSAHYIFQNLSLMTAINKVGKSDHFESVMKTHYYAQKFDILGLESFFSHQNLFIRFYNIVPEDKQSPKWEKRVNFGPKINSF